MQDALAREFINLNTEHEGYRGPKSEWIRAVKKFAGL